MVDKESKAMIDRWITGQQIALAAWTIHALVRSSDANDQAWYESALDALPRLLEKWGWRNPRALDALPPKSRMSVSCRLLMLNSADDFSLIWSLTFPNNSVSRKGDVNVPSY